MRLFILIALLPTLGVQFGAAIKYDRRSSAPLESPVNTSIPASPAGTPAPASTIPLPFPIPTTVDPWVQETFVDGVLGGNLIYLDQAINAALEKGIHQMQDWGITDSQRFLLFTSGMLYWKPSEISSGKLIYWVLVLFYFIMDQPPLGNWPFSVPIVPQSKDQKLPLDDWIVKFAIKVGEYMDQPGSISQEAVKSFQESPLYHFDEAYVPPEGFDTFNSLFARKLKPGMRPISSPGDDSVVVYPADSTFKEALPINDAGSPGNKSNTVSVKHIDWPIADLLKDSKYASNFAGGHFMHAFLGPYDYHRQHAPVSGTVVEANVIQGLAYLEVVAVKNGELHLQRASEARLRKRDVTDDVPDDLYSELDAPDSTGYQFLQTRGLVIIDNPLLGKVAVLPIGMAQVSSVKLVWEPQEGESYPLFPNTTINKGDEISHFQFGGSDIVLVFEKGADVKILGATGIDGNGTTTSKQKYLVGMPLAVSSKRSEGSVVNL